MQKLPKWQSIPKSNFRAWLILCAGLLATVYASYIVKTNVEREVQREFVFDSNLVVSRIEGRLQAHKQVLLGGAALFDASESVGRNEWREYTKRMQIDRHFNGVHGLGFSLLIPKSQLSRHIEEMRKQGFSDYTVRPAGERDVYSSVIYLEPFKDRNLRAFGYDMYADPVRRAAMEKARDENIAVLSGKVMLVQETDKDVQAGTLMYVPVYRKQMLVNTVEQRRAALIGWVYSPFRMDDLLRGVLQGWNSPGVKHLHLRVYDGSSADAASLLYDSEAQDKDAYSAPQLFQLEQRTDFNGRVWTLRFSMVKGSVKGIDYSKAWGTFVAGLSASLLLFFLALSYLNTRRNAHRIADELTEELRSHVETERVLSEQLQLQSTALNASANAIVITDAEGVIKWANPAFSELTGYQPDETVGHRPKELLRSGWQDQPFYERLWQTILAGRAWHGELINRRKDGSLYNEEMTITPVMDAQGKVTHFIAVKQDITERKMSEVQIHNLAFYDALTQLSNRRLLDDRLNHAVAASKRNGCYGALLFLDLDNFKPLNDTHGHVVGDLLLIEVAKRLKGCVREMDTVARFGGDEFIVLLSELVEDKAESIAQAGIVAEKIRSALAIPYLLRLPHDGQPRTVEHRCTASIGVAMFSGLEITAEEALKRADMAMYQAKENGRNLVRFYPTPDQA